MDMCVALCCAAPRALWRASVVTCSGDEGAGLARSWKAGWCRPSVVRFHIAVALVALIGH
jgi:hypothetical protein